ncbi:TadE/TadG family type IV pilus assembly protein [Cupriavidus oxalaticus]|uniref:TadE/TadG family type IV pilus assembly protein n=1 Tax=Cupriavidus oxalaticus TaxID=96344 RepID=UPI003F73FA18
MQAKQKQKGVAAVEFAIVLPVLLMIVFGIVDFGVGLYNKAVLTNAAREGARVGIVLRSPKYTAADVNAVVQQYAANYLITFGTTNTPVVDATAGIGESFGQPLTVKVSWTYSGLWLGRFYEAFANPLVLSSTAVMNNE